MTSERYNELMGNKDASLTNEEVMEGWGFCNEYDGLLLNTVTSPECLNCGICTPNTIAPPPRQRRKGNEYEQI